MSDGRPHGMTYTKTALTTQLIQGMAFHFAKAADSSEPYLPLWMMK